MQHAACNLRIALCLSTNNPAYHTILEHLTSASRTRTRAIAPPNNTRRSRCSQLYRRTKTRLSPCSGVRRGLVVKTQFQGRKAPKCKHLKPPCSNHRLTVTCRSKDSLSVALKQFQDCLTPDQRDQFRAIGSPTVADIVSLTDEVNEKDSSRKSRVWAQRTRVILESVQQYSAVVDTFAQANPAISALVWGSIKFVILVAGHESTV